MYMGFSYPVTTGQLRMASQSTEFTAAQLALSGLGLVFTDFCRSRNKQLLLNILYVEAAVVLRGLTTVAGAAVCPVSCGTSV